jgi:hypothetical protein
MPRGLPTIMASLPLSRDDAMKVRCPQCSTIVDATSDPIRCPNCGFTAPMPRASAASPPMSPSAPVYAPPPPPGVSAYAGARPVGKKRSPGLVVFFSIITFGIYLLFWQWMISNEMDRFTGVPGRHKPIRIGIVVELIGVALALLGTGFFVSSVPMGATPETITGDLVGGVILIALGLLAVLIGGIVALVGLYRLWTAVQQDDQMRGDPNPTSATLLLVLVILGFVVPYVGFVLILIAYFLTQKGLNRTWAAYGGMPMASGTPGAW